MKRLGLLIVVLILSHGETRMVQAAPVSSARPGHSATSGNFGAGVMFGDPTGLTGKYWLNRINAFDVGLSYSFGSYFAILGNYLWHFPNAFSGSSSQVAHEFIPYIGIGGVLFFDTGDSHNDSFIHREVDDDVALGVRIPLGIEFLPRGAPIGVFVELVPGLGIAPGIFGFFQGDIGIRFYF